MVKEQKEFLEEQLQWTKEQIAILDEMDSKLQEMKKIAVYAAENEIPTNEIEKLNSRLKGLQIEYSFLENQRHTQFH